MMHEEANWLAGLVSRVILVVLDSVGIGALPDAADYGDEGANTLGNVARKCGGLALPHFGRLGLGRLTDVAGVPPAGPAGACGRLMLRSPGKDTVTGHWELGGIILEQPLRTFPAGFPPDLIDRFEQAIGRSVLGNEVASGTEIIARLGPEHMRTGQPIVYTSADSVMQIAAHEDVIPVAELYEMCERARSLLVGDWLVGRVIARPFTGEPGAFVRTERRHDYALDPPGTLLSDVLSAAGLPVISIGKVADIFNGRGFTGGRRTRDNADGIDATLAAMATTDRGLIFANLVDFDSLYGHRNDWRGYGAALEYADSRVPELEAALRPGDVLIFTADHGCDPTTPGTDHSREYVPLLVTGPPVRHGVDVGTRPSLADLGETVADLLGVAGPGTGTSFAADLVR